MFHTPPENASWSPQCTRIHDDSLAAGQAPTDPGDRDLPPELQCLISRFLAGLQEPKYDKPPTASEISLMYQEFYTDFQARTHQLLKGYDSDKYKSALVQLQSFEEIAAKRRERKSRLLRERHMLELAERAICTPVYHKISRIPVGPDIAHNERIQTKLVCLSQMQVSLTSLGLDVDSAVLDSQLDRVQTEFENLDLAQSPSQKLAHLSQAQKIIVTALADKTLLTSADAILPAFIYSVVHLKAPNLYLNLKYIERFRCQQLMSGENQYTLTNLQAVVGFLDTVTLDDIQFDISNLPAGIPPDLFTANSTAKPSAAFLTLSSPPSVITPSTSSSSSCSSHVPVPGAPAPPAPGAPAPGAPAPPGAPARLSLLHPTELAANAVNSADQSLKSLGTTFNSSYRFFVGRFARDQNTNHTLRPATLEEAKRVIGLSDDPAPAPAPAARGTTALLDKLVDLSGLKPLRASTSLQNISTGSAPVPAIQYKFLHADSESLQLGEVRELLAEYKKLVKFVQNLS